MPSLCVWFLFPQLLIGAIISPCWIEVEEGEARTLQRWFCQIKRIAKIQTYSKAEIEGFVIDHTTSLMRLLENRPTHEKSNAVSILGPFRPNVAIECETPPDQAAILRAMPLGIRGIPFILEEFRDDYQFKEEKVSAFVDPPRIFPLIGPARLHHCKWKCTITYTQSLNFGRYSRFMISRRCKEIVFIDMEHLHLVIDKAKKMTKDHANQNND